ncbi:heavy-metal-associated domain-containing protein, partial [Enterobacter hormaechei]|uniref:heavy-metal-associated domain-containing protein n=1 Tax=Enterobacter hormaechei TaxID=158836 RepID=UPI0022F08C03
VADMKCGACAGRIQRAIVGMDEQARIEINIQDRTLQIAGQATEAEYAEAIQEAGYTPALVEPVASQCASTGAAHGSACCG